jgi:hypothetical protein
MATSTTASVSASISNSRFDRTYAPTSSLLRWGKREILVRRDYRAHFYRVNRFIDCNPGVVAGYLEILFFRRWLVILSKAR